MYILQFVDFLNTRRNIMLNFIYTQYQNRELSIVKEAAENGDLEAKNELLLRSPFNGKNDILKMDAILLCSEILRKYPNHLLANCCRAISALQNKDAGLAEQYLLLALQDI